MDWSGCDLVEIVEGKVSGVPLVRDTRIPADFVLESYQSSFSIEDVLDEFPRLTRENVQQLLRFAAAEHAVSST